MQEWTHNLRDDGNIGPKSLEIQFARWDTIIVHVSFRQNAVQDKQTEKSCSWAPDLSATGSTN